MSVESGNNPTSLWHSVTRITEKLVIDGASYDTIITILTLFCLISVLQRNTPATSTATTASPLSGGLGKLLGDLTKGDGGGLPADTLMSLLPLLNSPQLKSKLNPSTISSVLGLLNNMGTAEKPEQPKPEKKDSPGESVAPPAVPVVDEAPKVVALEPVEPKPLSGSRFLNWKSSF